MNDDKVINLIDNKGNEENDSLGDVEDNETKSEERSKKSEEKKKI